MRTRRRASDCGRARTSIAGGFVPPSNDRVPNAPTVCVAGAITMSSGAIHINGRIEAHRSLMGLERTHCAVDHVYERPQRKSGTQLLPKRGITRNAKTSIVATVVEKPN